MGPFPWRVVRAARCSSEASYEVEHLLANPSRIGSQARHMRCDSFAFTHHDPQQEVLGPDVIVTKLKGLPQREFEHLLGSGRERWDPVDIEPARTDAPMVSSTLARTSSNSMPICSESFRRHAIGLMDEAEENVLRSDEVVVEEGRSFLLGQNEDLRARSVKRSNMGYTFSLSPWTVWVCLC